jgi:hypothetical protein
MSQRPVRYNETSAAFWPAVLAALDRGLGTRPRRWLVGITLLLGLLAAVALNAAGDPADRTFAGLSGPAQLLMSVTLPVTGVLFAEDLRRSSVPLRLTPTLLAATLVAIAVGAFGAVVCATAVAVAPSGAAADRWDHAVVVALGGVLVQITAQLTGTGLGLLLRPVVVASLATIVLPLGLWFVLGIADVLRPVQAWLVPYPTAQNLLSGQMGLVQWAQWFAVVLIWGVGLNALGAARQKGRSVSR